MARRRSIIQKRLFKFFKDLLCVLISLSAFIEVVPLTPNDVHVSNMMSVFDHISKQREESSKYDV